MYKPITRAEFCAALARCRPPTGWKETIAVAFSGGIDSTCLLYLLHWSLSDRLLDNLPKAVRSFTINHDLQQASTTMAAHCERFAAKLGVEHLTIKLDWGQHPYPPRPPEQNYETVARDARYHALFTGLQSSSTDTIAFAHHADDQVETAIMRLVRGSSLLGASGMRPCRRWGMGTSSKSPLTYVGVPGMSNWIIRPFLGFSKDRLKATCEEHGLDYVDDPSNFQPDMTLRNAIRAHLSGNILPHALLEDTAGQGQPQLSEALRQPAERQFLNFDTAVRQLGRSPAASKDELRVAVAQLQDRTREIDDEVDRILGRCRLPSPVGTLLIDSTEFSKHLNDPMIATALVFRALRYVSPHPWGSLQAESSRSGEAVRRIIKCIRGPQESSAFSVGSGVLWTPVHVASESGRIKPPTNSKPSPVGYSRAWILSRMPAYRNHPSPTVDITEEVLRALPSSSDVEVLLDNRYLVRLRTKQLPSDIMDSIRNDGSFKLEMALYSKWFFPSITWHHSDNQVTLCPPSIDSYGLDAQSVAFIQPTPVVKGVGVSPNGLLSASWVRPVSSL